MCLNLLRGLTYMISALGIFQVSIKESVWQTLEEEMVPSLSNAKTTWLDVQSKLLPNKLKQSNVCVAGEALKVEIAFKNPLQLSIPISNVTIMCEHSANETLSACWVPCL